MQKLDQRQRIEEQELAQMHEEIGMSSTGLPGRQSEPTTPPEYREPAGFPSMFSRPNRYSTSSIASPPGLFNNRPARSGSQLASPQAGILGSRFAFDDQLPSRSVPGSRRNSDEDEKEEAVRQDPTSHRSTNAYVRPFLCMFCYRIPAALCPVTARDRERQEKRVSCDIHVVGRRAALSAPWGAITPRERNFPA